MWVDMTSPDGKINIRIGDPYVPQSYNIPNALFDRYGATEGKMAVNKVMILRYEGGQAFANLYGQGRFGQSCQNVAVTDMKVLPAIHTVPIPGAHSDAGQAVFRCLENGQEMGGYVVAETIFEPLAKMPNLPAMADWYLTGLGSFLAPKAQADEVYKMFWHSAASFRINPEWLAVATKIANRGAQQNFAAGQKQIQASNEQFRQWSAQSARQSEDFNRALMGQTLQVDPNTGQAREIASGPWNTYWSNGKGQTVSSALSPGPGYQPMTPAK
jgi:hypothetical protein